MSDNVSQSQLVLGWVGSHKMDPWTTLCPVTAHIQTGELSDRRSMVTMVKLALYSIRGDDTQQSGQLTRPSAETL